MPSHADTGKREHSSDEESLGHTGSGHTKAAGTARPHKISKLNDGKETMDADFEVQDASVSTPTLDGSHRKDTDIPTSFPSSQITETMTPESSRSIYSPVTPTASYTARNAPLPSLVVKRNESCGTASKEVQQKIMDGLRSLEEWKRDVRSSVGTFVTSGSLLYDKIVEEHNELVEGLVKEGKDASALASFDPLKEWFHRLGLPCRPERMKILSSKKKQVIEVEQTESEKVSGNIPHPQNTPRVVILTAQSDLDHSAPSSSGGQGTPANINNEATDTKDTGRHLTASTLDNAIMSRYYNWVFTFPRARKGTSEKQDATKHNKSTAGKPRKPINIYGPEYQCTTTHSIHEIVERPQPEERGGKIRCLARLIENHLLCEKDRMLDPETPLPKLRIPIEWEEEASRPVSSFHEISEDYNSAFPLLTKGAERNPEPCDFHTVTASENSSQTSDPAPDEGEASDPSTPTQQKFPLPDTADPEAKESEERHTVKTPLEEEEERKRREADLRQKSKENSAREQHLSKRTLLQSLSDLPNVETCIVMMSREEIRECDKKERCGDTTYNEETLDPFEYPPNVIKRFLNHAPTMKLARSEGVVESTVGSTIRGIITGEKLTAHANQAAPFPPHLVVVGSRPSPDCFARASSKLGWPKSLLPVLYAAEAKPIQTFNENMIGAQLAAAFHGTLIILILYYLDTRESLHSPMPPWLFLYGVEYTESGVNIAAHHPRYVFDGDTGHWELHAKLLTKDYFRVFQTGDPRLRVRLLAVFLRIRSHTLFVLEQLEKWERGRAVLDVLIKEKKRPARSGAIP